MNLSHIIIYTVYPYKQRGNLDQTIKGSRDAASARVSVDRTFGRRPKGARRTDAPEIRDRDDDGDDDFVDVEDVLDDDDAVDARETSGETRTDGDDYGGIEKQDDILLLLISDSQDVDDSSVGIVG